MEIQVVIEIPTILLDNPKDLRLPIPADNLVVVEKVYPYEYSTLLIKHEIGHKNVEVMMRLEDITLAT